MTSDLAQLEQAMTALEAQRSLLGDAVVDAALAPMRDKLAALRASHAPAEQRKLITILFADVSGFTAMAEQQDPEEVHAAINTVWTRLDALIESYGGRIDKHIGDAVMALWGTETAREDDAERAIRAALAMQAALRALTGAHSSIPLSMRIGINTGLVLLGTVGTRSEFTAMGDAVNLASRLEQAAPVKGILISHDTYRHVRGVFDVQARDPITVKGKTEPVQVYAVQRTKPRAFHVVRRGVEGVETRLIGRATELKTLQNAFDTTVEDGEVQVVTVVGEAGVGKTRLLNEFEEWLDVQPRRIWYFKGRADEGMTGLPYALLRDLLAHRFHIQDSDPLVEARQTIEQGIVASMPDDQQAVEKAHFIGHLLGFDFSASPFVSTILSEGAQLRQRAFFYLTQFFRSMSRQQATVVLLEDIHWADDGSLDALDYLAREMHSASRHSSGQAVPLLMVGLARDTLFERRPLWGEGQPFHTRLQLRPLDRRDTRRLVEAILHRADSIPAEMRDMVVNGAQGNPFYVEELIKMLIEAKVIVTGVEGWHVELARLSQVRVPPTLSGVLQARLDALPPAERETLKRASVVGQVFWDAVVAHMASHTPAREQPDATGPALSQLRQREMVYGREVSQFSGSREYTFKHALLRDVTYESVLLRERRPLHALVAIWLAERSGERADEFAALIAEHYERGGETAQAAHWYARAGKQAQATNAPEVAIRYYQQALTLTAGASLQAEPIELYAGLGEMLRYRARYAEAIQTYTKMRLAAEAMGDVAAQARAWNGVARVQSQHGDQLAAIDAADRAASLAQSAGEELERVVALNHKCFALTYLGRGAETLLAAEQALALSTGLRLRSAMALSLRSMGFAYSGLGDLQQANDFMSRALTMYHDLGERRSIAAMSGNLGLMALMRGDMKLAIRRYRESLSLHQELGNRDDVMVCLNNMASAQLWLGEFTAAEANARQAIQMGEAAGSQLLAWWYATLARAYLGQKQLDKALRAAQQSLTLALTVGSSDHLNRAWRALGLVMATFLPDDPVWLQPNKVDAEEGGNNAPDSSSPAHPAQCFDASLKVLSGEDFRIQHQRALTLWEWARYELTQGDRTHGEALWRQARALFEQLGLPLFVARMGEMPSSP